MDKQDKGNEARREREKNCHLACIPHTSYSHQKEFPTVIEIQCMTKMCKLSAEKQCKSDLCVKI